MLHVVVLEDDEADLLFCVHLVQQTWKEQTFSIKTFQNPDVFLFDIDHYDEVNLLIINTDFKCCSGIEIASRFYQIYPQATIIFIGDNLESAVLVYDVPHVYYVYKRDLQTRLPKGLTLALQQIVHNRNTILNVRWKNTLIYIHMDEIIYIERNKRRSIIVTSKKEYISYIRLEEIMKSLGNGDFLRVHNSFVVHVDDICEFHRDYLIMRNNAYIPVSRSYEKEARLKIEHIFQKGDNRSDPRETF